ncbi:MAG: adenylosuccinate lyase [Candidatus Bathyarchaeota archaeon]|nr:MAG: adenylosuccinate lyase [Candidatus Bathyarchaeota archaeon]
MPIIPIDTGRYGSPEMRKIFDEENRLQKMLEVEGALAWAHSQVGNIPKKDAKIIVEKASIKYVKLERVKAIENEIRHDVMALVRALAEQCGSSGEFVHLGATSSDMLDTATALQLKEAVNVIENRLNELESVLLERAEKHKTSIMMGRSHGQHALPTTFGFKASVWTREIARNIQRLHNCKKRLLDGKMSGAVGTQAGLGPKALEIQELVMQRLGIDAADISTQIVQRDRYAELTCTLAILACSMDNIANEIRQLQRPEIAEAFEAFEQKKQVGSSTMPHKRNPMISERICGLAKILRSLVSPALENVRTWHERDLTQSSCERFVIPEECILIDYMLILMVRVLKGLQIDETRMSQNMNITQGRMMSESVMLTLAKKGLGRQKAHELTRQLAIESHNEQREFKDALSENSTIKELLTPEELEKVIDPRNYLGTVPQQIERVIQKTKQERKARGLTD